MYKENPVIFQLIITVAVFMVLAIFIVIFVIIHRLKQKRNLEERKVLEASFEREILRTQLEIQERTLKHISQEIHDNVGQVLSLAKLYLATIEPGAGSSFVSKVTTQRNS